MEHYVQYHNADVMGVSCREFDEDEGFGIVTNKPVSKLRGSKVWLISGEGSPRKYFLCYWFIVDEVGQSEDPDFKFYATGHIGVFLRPPILLNQLPWFKDFLKSQRNFWWGLRKIEDRYIVELEELASGYEQQVFEEQACRIGAGFGSPETNRQVEQAAISFVTKDYESRGWMVQSVEAGRRGFDLLCTKDALEEHVEVKGIQGEMVSFIVTAGEFRQAQSDNCFVLCVVTSALSDHPRLFRYSAKDFFKWFDLAPLTFRATLRV